jgi:redox-sensitive bicupin YhaK (pirin superfamily)
VGGDDERRGARGPPPPPPPRDGAVTLHADASIRAGLFDGDESAELALDPKRLAYVHVAEGEVTLNGEHRLRAGDGVTLDGETRLQLGAGKAANVLVFDLARLD